MQPDKSAPFHHPKLLFPDASANVAKNRFFEVKISQGQDWQSLSLCLIMALACKESIYRSLISPLLCVHELAMLKLSSVLGSTWSIPLLSTKL